MIITYLCNKNISEKINIQTIVYPDGTKSHNLELTSNLMMRENRRINAKIHYYYESPVDYLDIASIVMTLKEQFSVNRIDLIIKYMPNARMDRIKNIGETFTLKVFANFINSLPIDRVFVFDPHSPVSELLLNKSSIMEKMIMNAVLIKHLNDHINNIFVEGSKFYIAFPDEGAQKRYIDIINQCNFNDNILGIFTGKKERDWQSGEIKNINVHYNGNIPLEKGSNIIIIDDICSKGGTFKYFIKTIQDNWKMSFNFYLYVSHLEPAVLEGDLLKDDSLNLCNILTTSSLKYLWKYRGLDMENIEKIKLLKEIEDEI